MQEGIRRRERWQLVVARERPGHELAKLFAQHHQPLYVRRDALLEHLHLAHGVLGRAERVAALPPEELELLEVLFGDIGDEGEHERCRCRRRSRQLMETAPPLMRFMRWAWATRSFPLMRIFPSSRMVIDPSPTRSVRECLASMTTSSAMSA